MKELEEMKKQYLTPSIVILGAEYNIICASNNNIGTDEDPGAKERGGSNLIHYGFESSSDDDEW